MEDLKIEGTYFVSLLACYISTKLTFTNLDEYAKEGALSLNELYCLRELSNTEVDINKLTKTSYIEIKDGVFKLEW